MGYPSASLTEFNSVNYNARDVRIGLLSDTHIPSDARELPPQVGEAFKGVDLILHAGDIYLVSVLDELEQIAPVLAAIGDDDPLSTIGADHRAKYKHILELEGLTLWLTHRMSDGYLLEGQNKESFPESAFCNVDIVIFGHEHRTFAERRNGVFFINPGSPTFLCYRRGLGTVGILDIESGKAKVDIIQLN